MRRRLRRDSIVWLWVAWREDANAGDPVSMTAETANSVAIVLRRITVGAEAAWVMAELLLGFITIGGDRF